MQTNSLFSHSPAAGWQVPDVVTAPDFCLPGTDGRFYSLSDVQGPNGVLIVLLANRCLFTSAILPRLVRDVAELHRYGVGAVAVNANSARGPEESFDAMTRFANAHRLPFPYLFDGEQSVAHALQATHTPDFFGFDRRLELRYRGRLDASRLEAAPEPSRREMFAAIRQIALFGSAPRHQLQGIGSAIKWAREQLPPPPRHDSPGAN